MPPSVHLVWYVHEKQIDGRETNDETKKKKTLPVSSILDEEVKESSQQQREIGWKKISIRRKNLKEVQLHITTATTHCAHHGRALVGQPQDLALSK